MERSSAQRLSFVFVGLHSVQSEMTDLTQNYCCKLAVDNGIVAASQRGQPCLITKMTNRVAGSATYLS